MNWLRSTASSLWNWITALRSEVAEEPPEEEADHTSKLQTIEVDYVDPITWEVFNQATRAIGLEPLDVRRELAVVGRTLDGEGDVDPPTIEQMDAFLEIVLANWNEVKRRKGISLQKLPMGAADGFFLLVWRGFIWELLRGYVVQRISSNGSISRRISTRPNSTEIPHLKRSSRPTIRRMPGSSDVSGP